MICGFLTERYSRKFLISGATIAVSACVVGMGFSLQFWQLVALRVLQGLSLGLMYPTIIGLLVDFFPPYVGATAVGFLSVGS